MATNLTGMATGVAADGVQRNNRAVVWNGRNRPRKYDGLYWRNLGIAPWQARITRIGLTTNVVTVTTASAHGLATSNNVNIFTVKDNDIFGGTFVVASVPTTTTFTYALTASNYTTVDAGGTVSIAPRVATTGSSGPSGTYYYWIVPANKTHPVYRNRVVCGLPSAHSLAVTVNNQGVAVSGIPSTHPDAQVTHWFLYRNKNGYITSNTDSDLQDWWKVAEIPIGTTTYTDVILDDALPPEVMDTHTNIPPTCKAGAVFAERLWQTGFDVYSTGTATVNSVTTTIDFSSATLPDGVVGCYFMKVDDDGFYQITERISTSKVCLDRPFVGTLSAASFNIFTDQSVVYFSEFNDFDAWGMDGQLFKNQLRVGGAGAAKSATAMIPLGNSLWIFTADSIYRAYVAGSMSDSRSLALTPTPVFDGVGCVGAKAWDSTDNEIYFLSQRGPMKFNGSSAPEPIGEKLGSTWLTGLNASQLSIAVVGFSPKMNTVKFSVPQGSDTENSLVYVYHRPSQTWWREEFVHPGFYFRDVDSSGRPALFYAQGAFVFEDDIGTSDGVPSGTITGTVTSTTTSTLTDSTASFYTTGTGLQERYVHIYNATTYALVGRRRITSNTGTVLTWDTTTSSTLGGGTLTLAAGQRYYIGPVLWWWKTKDYAIADQAKRSYEAHFQFQVETTPSSMWITQYHDNNSATAYNTFTCNTVHKKLGLDARNFSFALKLEGRQTNSDIGLQDLTMEHQVEKDK